MKYAFCFRGIHYIDGIQKDYKDINYEKSYNNNKKLILNDLLDYDIFLSTYHSKKENDLLNLYKPINSVFLNFDPDDSTFKLQLIHHLNCCKMIVEQENKANFKYDMIIITRFDNIFFRNFNSMNIDFTKFNIQMKHSSGNCDDNFWVFPRNLLEKFFYSCFNLLQTGGITHAINHCFQAEEIHYMYIIDQEDYDNYTMYQYCHKNNYDLDRCINQVNKYKYLNIVKEQLL